MALRDKYRDRAQPFLQEGEQIQEVFGAQTASQWWIVLAMVVFIIKNEYRIVVVTDRRIIVTNAGKWGMATPKEHLRDLPRATQMGPAEGKLWYETEALGERVFIHRRFWGDVNDADAARA